MAAHDALTLYVEAFWLSPWSFTDHVALTEKRLAFQTGITMLRHGVGAIDAMRERTLTGTAPVLHHGAVWLSESLAIVEYLEEAFPPPTWPRLYPADVRDRARARQIMSWVRTSHEALRRERPSHVIFYPGAVPLAPLSDVARRAVDDLCFVTERLGVGAARGLFGDFCIADADVAFALMRVVATGTPLPAATAAYVAATWARPSVRGFVEHPRPPRPPSD